MFQICRALNGARPFPRLAENGKKHSRENGDDRNHNQELYQGENFCFQPDSKNRRTRNSEVRRNGKTFEQWNNGTTEQSNEERKNKSGSELTHPE